MELSHAENMFYIKKDVIIAKVIPFFIITLSIFVDLGNGIIQMVVGSNLSIGVLYRGVFLICLLPFLYNRNSVLKYFLTSIVFLFVINNVYWLFSQKHYSLMFEVTSISKVLYLYIITHFYCVFFNKIQLDRLINYTIYFGSIAGGAIVFSFFTGISIKTYGDYAFGVKSFFQAQNDVSLSLLIILAFSIYLLLLKKSFFYLIVSVVITSGCVFLGTRTGIAGSILIWILLIGRAVIVNNKDLRLSKLLRFILFFVGTVVVVVAIFYLIELILNSNYLLRKFSLEIFTGSGPRGFLVESGIKTIKSGSFFDLIFGLGKYGFYKENHYIGWLNYGEMLAVEVDYLDMVGSYGIILGVLILIFPIIVLLLGIHNFFKYKLLFDFTLLVSMVVYVGHSFFAGHAIASPLVSTIISVVILLILKRGSIKFVDNEYITIK